MSGIEGMPLYLIMFDDTEVPVETMFGEEVARKRFEQVSQNWNAHLFVKVKSNSRDDMCAKSNHVCAATDYDALLAERDQLKAEVERLKGLHPDFPPRPPDGDGLPRYGLRWNGPQQPLAVPMTDGYWTPWHLAERLEVGRDYCKRIAMHNVEVGSQTQAKLVELVSAVRSINYGAAHKVMSPGDDEPQYRQRKEWIEWVLELCDAAVSADKKTGD